MNNPSPTLHRIGGAAGLLLAAAVLAGCSSGPLAPYLPTTADYRCDNGVSIAVDRDGKAILQTGRGVIVLERDAGGVGPEQAVYSNPEMRLETGLPPDARGATLEGLVPNGKARCSRGSTLYERVSH